MKNLHFFILIMALPYMNIYGQCTEPEDFNVISTPIGSNNCSYEFEISYTATSSNTAMLVKISCGTSVFENLTCTGELQMGSHTMEYGTYTTVCCEDPIELEYTSHTNNYCTGFECASGLLSISLPVKLLFFNAAPQGNNIEFSWATAQEINNDYFQIERSYDGYTFESIKKVEGKGNSNLENQYYVTLPFSIQQEKQYFRLSQTDYDGSQSYSKIILVETARLEEQMIFPNPSNGIIHLTMELEGEVIIYNSLGLIVKNFTLQSPTSVIDLTDLSIGTYFLQNNSLKSKLKFATY